MSALDSIIPSDADKRRPGPVMEFGFPAGQRQETLITGTGIKTLIGENDSEAAQVLVDREYALLCRYLFSEYWQEAWIRFYRMIYRDSWGRISDAVFQLERNWNMTAIAGGNISGNERAFAQKALSFVQGFKYERDPDGSDFVNLVSAVTEGRGDCDSRVMLWVMILQQANIPASMMISQNYSHAMGLADIPGTGARFEAGGIKWLVAETTAKVDIGLISQDMSDVESWFGVMFE